MDGFKDRVERLRRIADIIREADLTDSVKQLAQEYDERASELERRQAEAASARLR